ncbi:MAG TPA: low molecular weight protein arginine phosphatase [Planococcus sp. (in: firmicutes)]|nr:low molecular weight protein arginine phosphatase [Planococcus sp. (in: firmicutes)]
MKIFFICTGNTCRSPMAQAIFAAKELEGVSVKSAGLFAGTAPLSANAQTVLDAHGIDFQHISKQLRPEDLDWASLVLTMTNSHKSLLVQNYPGSSDKIFTLKEFVEGSVGDISDPYGGPLAAYEQTFAELHRLIDGLADMIEEE